MKDKIAKILEREIAKFERLSKASEDPLASQDVKSLDTLIKAYRTFAEPQQPGAAQPAASGPASQTTDELLNDLASQEIHTS